MLSKIYNVRLKSHHDSTRALKSKFQLECNKEEYVNDILGKRTVSNTVLYFHVPFCNKICSFCPFHRRDKLKRSEYHTLLINQMEQLSKYDYSKKIIKSVYFGGGTPTTMKPKQFEEVLITMKKCFTLEKNAEISVETSASELTDEMLEVFVKHGVNRLSIGIQTFNDKHRKLLNRRNTGEFALSRVKRAIEYGITNTNIDLIYNIPTQTKEELKDDINKILNSGVAGISYYSLQLHEKTPLFNSLTDSQKEWMDNIDNEYELFCLVYDTLKNNKYNLFELTKLINDNKDEYQYISNRHNLGSCIAVGVGAGGNLDNYLYYNAEGYETISNTPISAMGRVVSDKYKIVDKFIYEFQKSKINLDEYSNLLNIDLKKLFAKLINDLIDDELVNYSNDEIVLTKKGVFFGNNIIKDFAELIINYNEY